MTSTMRTTLATLALVAGAIADVAAQEPTSRTQGDRSQSRVASASRAQSVVPTPPRARARARPEAEEKFNAAKMMEAWQKGEFGAGHCSGD